MVMLTFAARLARRDFWLEKCVSIRCQLFLGVECCATFQAALYIETHSMMHQSEFDAANVALSRQRYCLCMYNEIQKMCNYIKWLTFLHLINGVYVT